ncbi:hypothetical protein GUJ93_ZPchr0012g19259 [Zizania palustris]|uniref:Uncharacterized protein n=1 Tax=Zizania palustris TaxID=103762 RepID=A0A8J6BT54_ZIZPA|nr:hypothetical protein GUJ93_ZPchr0012g19259 [Zizania palustris]
MDQLGTRARVSPNAPTIGDEGITTSNVEALASTDVATSVPASLVVIVDPSLVVDATEAVDGEMPPTELEVVDPWAPKANPAPVAKVGQVPQLIGDLPTGVVRRRMTKYLKALKCFDRETTVSVPTSVS